MGVISDLEVKINDFIKSTPTFQKACQDAFVKHDTSKDGKISLDEAAAAMSSILDNVEAPLEGYGIKLDKNVPVADYVKKYDVNGDGMLDKVEFQDFYKKMLVVSAAKATSGFGKKYGMSIVLGTMVIAGVNAIIRSNVTDYSNIIQWMPAVVVGPLLGMSTVYIVDKTVGEDLDGQQKTYVEENNKKTATPDPAAPTKTLVEDQKKKDDKAAAKPKKTSRWGR